MHLCCFSGPHPQTCEPAITHVKVIHFWDNQRSFSCHSCTWRQEFGNEFQQDNKILPASCCNVLVLRCHPGSPVCGVTSALMARTQGQCHFERAEVVPLSGERSIILPGSRNQHFSVCTQGGCLCLEQAVYHHCSVQVLGVAH